MTIGFTKSLWPERSNAPEGEIPKEIRIAFANLREDPYAPGSGRYRSYSRMVYLPWRDSLEWVPEIERDGNAYAPYDQGRFNGEFQNVRYFPGVAQMIRSSTFLEGLIKRDLQVLSGAEAFKYWPVYVGVHLIRLLVQSGNRKAGTTPDYLHQDGGTGMFTFVHMMGLSNTAGGETMVATPGCVGMSPLEVSDDEQLAYFKLASPLDWYAVNDQAVSHHAAPIRADDVARPASRDIVLLGISPYKPIFG
ncbi:2OG-Fe dioxygenase family protein [Mycobacterium arosiense]|nr:2OG-Fe dioxygenase family protein [Mycobacterium arosiense]